jgi:thiol:disulfide interchange protein DsbD
MSYLRLFIFLCCIPFFAIAQNFGTNPNADKNLNENPMEIKDLLFSKTDVKAGDTIELKLKLQLANGFHAYLDQYKLELVEPKDAYLSEFQISPTTKFNDPISKKTKIGTSGYSEMVALFEIPKHYTGGEHLLKIKMTYQACGEKFCLFTKSIFTEKKFNIIEQNEDALSKALSRGIFSALIFVFLAGFLTSLTPCIFPMIPITLAVIGTQSQTASKWRGFSVSLVYVLGIAITYALLGVMAAMTGALFGSLLGHPMVIGVIALLFVTMGLSMYGLYEIQLPRFLLNKLGNAKTEKGYVGAFLSGLLAGVVASPCVGPVLISILTYVAKTQDTSKGFLLLFVFALGLGQLFLVAGTFQGLLHKLPRSGRWMENVKYIFGTIMIGMALYFIYPVAPILIFKGIVATVVILISLFFGAIHLPSQKWQRFTPFHNASPLQRSFFRLTLLLGVVLFVSILTPQKSEKTADNYAKPEWHVYSEELLNKAKTEKRPVILDFQAEWCLACKELELYTFSDPRILAYGKKFLWLKFDATQTSPELEELQKKYEIGGLPYVTFFDENGLWRKELTLFGFEKADQFLERMQGL